RSGARGERVSERLRRAQPRRGCARPRRPRAGSCGGRRAAHQARRRSLVGLPHRIRPPRPSESPRGGTTVNRAVLALASACAAAAAAAAQNPQTTFRTGVEIVEIDVSVTRDGEPVAGMTDAALYLAGTYI